MPHQTPLGYLFLRSLLPGRVSYRESGIGFGLERTPDETVLMFKVDEPTSPKGKGGVRAESLSTHFAIEDTDPRSDLMLLIIRKGTGGENEIRLAVVELKGSDHKRAIEQLERTLVAVRQKLEPLFGSHFFEQSNLRALIVTNGSPPQDIKKKQLEFYNKWRFALGVFKSGNDSAIREYLK